MTIDELRSFCMALPGTDEKLTWGDGEHEGDVTFRVKNKIFLITGRDGGGATIRTSMDQQAELMDAFPDAFSSAAYVGRFGWVSARLDLVDSELIRGVIEGAWRRTAPKAVVAEFDAASR